MWLGGNGPRTLKSLSGMTRAEIASAVEQIIAAVAEEYGLVEAKDTVTLRSGLHDDLGMDEVDLIEVVFRAEKRFGLALPDNGIGLSSTVSDVVDLVAARLREQEAPLRLPQVIKAARETKPVVEIAAGRHRAVVVDHLQHRVVHGVVNCREQFGLARQSRCRDRGLECPEVFVLSHEAAAPSSSSVVLAFPAVVSSTVAGFI